MIWDSLSYSGPVAAHACGAAHTRLLFAFDYIGRMRADFLNLVGRQPVEWQEDPMAEWLSAKLSRYDCTFAEEVITGQWTIDVTPEWMRLPLDLDYLTMRYVPASRRGSTRNQSAPASASPRECPAGRRSAPRR